MFSMISEMNSAANGNNGSVISNNIAGLANANRGQMDMNMLYQKLLDLSDILKENHEKTQGIVASAEEFAIHRVDNVQDSEKTTDNENSILNARIADISHENLELRATKELLLREQRENNRLLGEYENAVGEILERLRNVSFERESERTKILQDYNHLLQEEKNAHLQTRLEKDDWRSRFFQALDMLRNAHKLRSLEEEEPLCVISGLQNEVRGYRQALGLDPEPCEDEFGRDFLRSK